MGTRLTNLFAEIPATLAAELSQTILDTANVRIERIISVGHTTAPGDWYDQDQHEFVVWLAGAARLRFADEDQLLALSPGSFVNIPAHRRHRVEWTTPDEPTVWLAIFYAPVEYDGHS